MTRSESTAIKPEDAYGDAVGDVDAMGHTHELKRHFSPLAMLGLAFAILNSWTALATSLSVALPSGGPTSVLWGLITAGVCNLCIASSLAEFLSAWPTAGGQYEWVAVVSWKSWRPILSWITGWINVGGWIALTATGGLLGSQLIVGIISLMNPDYVSERWHQFLIYIAYNIGAFFLNAFGNRLLPLVDKTAIYWSMAGFVIVSITILACGSGDYNSAEFVFTDFINETGWPDGVAWLLGLLQGGFGLTGYDAVAHMVDEISDPAVEGPKIMIYCVAIGTFTGFIFLMCLLFVAGDITQVIDSGAGPLLQILYNATNSRAGAICLLMFPLVCTVFATVAIMTASSRMTYAFARDRGLPASSFFSKVNAKLGVPVNSLMFTLGWVVVFGCIFLGSSSAFNAITSASVIALSITYGMPIAVNCLQMRRKLPASRAFIIPTPIAWIANIIALAYIILTTVLFFFPEDLPVTGSNMNYCIVVFGVWMIICLVWWFIDGRKNYAGPQVEIDGNVITGKSSNVENSSVSGKMSGSDVPDSKETALAA